MHQEGPRLLSVEPGRSRAMIQVMGGRQCSRIVMGPLNGLFLSRDPDQQQARGMMQLSQRDCDKCRASWLSAVDAARTRRVLHGAMINVGGRDRLAPTEHDQGRHLKRLIKSEAARGQKAVGRPPGISPGTCHLWLCAPRASMAVRNVCTRPSTTQTTRRC